MTERSTEDILDDHIACRQDADIEGDLERNYAPDVVQLTMEGTFLGLEGVRQNNATLRSYFEGATFDIVIKRVYGRYAFIEWRAQHGDLETSDGSDSFVIENGRIVFQSVRYTVTNAMRHRRARDDTGRS